jgi:hypothetical protein
VPQPVAALRAPIVGDATRRRRTRARDDQQAPARPQLPRSGVVSQQVASNS